MNRLLVVGLGNPGDRYADTRHNLGARTVEALATRSGERLRVDRRCSARTADLRLDGNRVVAAVPTTWMNDSGRAVVALVRRYELDDWSHLVVVHDELDLAPGRVKVKLGGGLAGNNGLRSVSQHLHTRDFARVRIGVGKPPAGPEGGADWVLARVSGSGRRALDDAAEAAADAVELIATSGLDAAMQRVNANP